MLKYCSVFGISSLAVFFDNLKSMVFPMECMHCFRVDCNFLVLFEERPVGRVRKRMTASVTKAVAAAT